eukprot:g2280.t1
MGDYTEAIYFSGKVLVIWGNNATLDAAGKGPFFNCTGDGSKGIKTSLELHGLGGAIYINGGTLTIQMCTFQGNTADSVGGAILIADGGTLTIQMCTFQGNKATYGGAIYIYQGSLTITDTTFTSNSANEKGGAIYIQDGSLIIRDSSFVSNQANGPEYGGGAIYFETRSSGLLHGCTFKNNDIARRSDSEVVTFECPDGQSGSAVNMAQNKLPDPPPASLNCTPTPTPPPTPPPTATPTPSPAAHHSSAVLEFSLIGAAVAVAFILIAVAWRRQQQQKNDTATQQQGASESVPVPDAIIQHGASAVRAYNNAITHGTQQLHWTKLMIVGQERAGKSSLLRTLTNQEHDPREKTTDGADTCVIQTKDWHRLESEPLYPSKFDEGIARSVGEKLGKQGQGQAGADKRWRQRCLWLFVGIVCAVSIVVGALYFAGSRRVRPYMRKANSSTGIANSAAVGANSSTGIANSGTGIANSSTGITNSATGIADSTTGIANFVAHNSLCPALLPLTTTPTRDVLRRMPTDLIVAVMDEGVQRHITFAVWDFAGQRVYYSVHHLFITRGVYIVVFSLEDAAHDMAGCLEYLAFWLHSVHAHTADASDYCILLVGTHSDVVDEISEQARVSRYIEAAFEDCGFWPQIEQPNAEEAEARVCYFPIDNTRPVQERVDDVWSRQLHERINTLGQQLVERKNSSYPVRWLQIYDELQQRADDGINFVVLGTSINVEQQFGWTASGERGLYPIARAYGIRAGSAEYQTVCTFLEEVGSFLRFQDLLILRPQWIADTLFAVVTRPQFQTAHLSNPMEDGAAADVMREWHAFEAGAVAGEKLLVQLWSNAKEDPQLLTSLLVHFDLMLELPVSRLGSTFRSFLVPSMLPTYRASTTALARLSGAEPACYLVFGQKNSDGVELLTVNNDNGATRVSDSVQGFIPEGFWFKLLVRCARWSQHTDSEWCIEHLTK